VLHRIRNSLVGREKNVITHLSSDDCVVEPGSDRDANGCKLRKIAGELSFEDSGAHREQFRPAAKLRRGDWSRHLRTGRGPDVRQVRRSPVGNGAVESWRFSPEKLSIDAGGTITAVNRGGEGHTFSEVDEFGGGCIQDVNDLLGLDPVPECENFPGPPGGPFFFATLAAPGESVTTAPLAAGTHKFLCLIHPWMRATVTAD
jgi:plastocyanin